MADAHPTTSYPCSVECLEKRENKIAKWITKPLERELTVMTYNVNRFHLCDQPDKMRASSERVREWNDEQLGVFHWNNRAPRIVQSILANDADFVALEELRWMETSSASVLTAHPEIERRYRFVEWVGNGTPLCMRHGLLYDYRRWFLSAQDMIWLSESPEEPSDFHEGGFGRVLGRAEFHPIDPETGKILMTCDPLSVFVTHLAVFPESLKHKEVKAICREIRHMHANLGVVEDNVVLMGDFNFFDDCEGGAMRARMERCLANIGKDAVYSQSGRLAERTFVPYEYDPMYEKLQSTCSVLDHIFASPKRIEKIGESWLDTRTYCEGDEPEELSDWNALPSDHMPLCARIKVTFKPNILDQ
jgi:exonuclease III